MPLTASGRPGASRGVRGFSAATGSRTTRGCVNILLRARFDPGASAGSGRFWRCCCPLQRQTPLRCELRWSHGAFRITCASVFGRERAHTRLLAAPGWDGASVATVTGGRPRAVETAPEGLLLMAAVAFAPAPAVAARHVGLKCLPVAPCGALRAIESDAAKIVVPGCEALPRTAAATRQLRTLHLAELN